MALLERGPQPGDTAASPCAPEAKAASGDARPSPTGAVATQVQASRATPLPTTHGPGI